MAQDPHATVPPVGSLDRVPFLNAARRRLEKILPSLTESPSGVPPINYLEPAGDPGIFGPDSVTWRVLSNPASVFIGGITAVIFELAEPRVRSGVWDHTDFRRDPARRVRQTGLATMAFTYGSMRDVEALTARVRRLHDRVRGTTPDGQAYQANDPELLVGVRHRRLRVHERVPSLRQPTVDPRRTGPLLCRIGPRLSLLWGKPHAGVDLRSRALP